MPKVKVERSLTITMPNPDGKGTKTLQFSSVSSKLKKSDTNFFAPYGLSGKDREILESYGMVVP